MLEFFQAGGMSMWFVLVFGALTLTSAIMFARAADPRRLATVRALTATTIFASTTGLLTNVLAVMRFVANDESLTDVPRVVMQGLGESITTPILGFAFLTVTWLVVATALRRIRDPLE